MQKRTRHQKIIPLTEFQSFGWPVKIRVRASSSFLAPRRPHIFPASLPDLIQPLRLLRTIEIDYSKPCRRDRTVFVTSLDSLTEVAK